MMSQPIAGNEGFSAIQNQAQFSVLSASNASITELTSQSVTSDSVVLTSMAGTPDLSVNVTGALTLEGNSVGFHGVTGPTKEGRSSAATIEAEPVIDIRLQLVINVLEELGLIAV